MLGWISRALLIGGGLICFRSHRTVTFRFSALDLVLHGTYSDPDQKTLVVLM